MRLLPFAETLERGLDKVRGRSRRQHSASCSICCAVLEFVGVPALQASPPVRKAIEEAWFSQRPIELRYQRSDSSVGTRRVRVTGVVMERHVTQLVCVDVDSAERRYLRLDRIERATLI